MPEFRSGSPIGLFRRATIRKYNEDGTVEIALDDIGLASVPQKYVVPLSSTWAGPKGEFIGGYPRVGSSIIVSQGQGGQFFIVSYIPSDTVFDSTTTSADTTLMSDLLPGRAFMQVEGGTKLFLDPKDGIIGGQDDNFIHIDPNRNILSHNLETRMEFTSSSRSINGVIKRDLVENSNRNILGSTLDSHLYDDSLFTIGLDPLTTTNQVTIGANVRNPPLVENRTLVYEFDNDFNFTTDEDENARYIDINDTQPKVRASRRDNRTDNMSLSLEAPNQLLEITAGTVVDTFGNILDLNRTALPIGKINSLSLRKNPDKSDAFRKIRAQLRKSLAYHFELNARKGISDSDLSLVRDVNDKTDYARDASKFFFDLDKEGQFKLNVPASSETGNVPLLTRHENFSVLLSKDDKSFNPNTFIRSDTGQEIFAEDFAGKSSIKLSGSDSTLDGYESPIDRFTDQPIKYGTAYHDISIVIKEFQTSADYLKAGLKLVNFDQDNRLNNTSVFNPLPKVVTDNLIVSGPKANAGGRSGSINMDGFISINVGANTADRQSMWVDTAGGIVTNYGRDLQGISWAGNFDGDILWQVGGPGIGNSFDSRFANQNDAYRNGTVDIRVMINGQLAIFRMGPEGISIISPGTITLSSQQDIILRSNSNILMEAESIVAYAQTSKRIINRMPAGQTIG